jgi:hypothetical protein
VLSSAKKDGGDGTEAIVILISALTVTPFLITCLEARAMLQNVDTATQRIIDESKEFTLRSRLLVLTQQAYSQTK